MAARTSFRDAPLSRTRLASSYGSLSKRRAFGFAKLVDPGAYVNRRGVLGPLEDLGGQGRAQVRWDPVVVLELVDEVRVCPVLYGYELGLAEIGGHPRPRPAHQYQLSFRPVRLTYPTWPP